MRSGLVTDWQHRAYDSADVLRVVDALQALAPDDIRGRLTDIEKKNIALIKRYEKYAEVYGDEFGR